MNGTYNVWLMALSVAVAVLASFVALDLTARVRATLVRSAAWFWLAGGSAMMGIGIWSMHFIGMLAFRLPMPMSYDTTITLLSLLIAIVVSGFALFVASRSTLPMYRLIIAGILMGLGIASMHYTGMDAMRIDPEIRYDPTLFVASIVIAIAAATAALRIAFSVREGTLQSNGWRKLGSAALMGAAIAGMHYTGMASAIFPMNPALSIATRPAVDVVWLAWLLGAFSTTLLAATLLVSMLGRRFARDIADRDRAAEALRASKAALETERQFLAVLLENLTDGIIACDEHGSLTLFNRATREFHGLPEQPLSPEQWSEHYGLYLADGQTPMPKEQIPLFRAFQGEAIRNVEIVVAPNNGDRRILLCNGQPLVSTAGGKLGAVVTMHDITERKQAEERLQELAHFDPLTALPNRTLFYQSLRDALAKAGEQQWIVSVLFLDIDHFKNVNDTMGHACGDELLRQVGRRLVQSLRVRDTVGRLGGDEFAIILVSPAQGESAAIVAGKLRNALRQPFDLGGREVTVTASIGATVFPADSIDAEALIKYADTAMYAAKEAGRDTFRFYTGTMNANVVRRLDLDNALRRALDHDEFVLHYQPKIDLESGRWTGVEALLRWNRPGHGLVPPGEFIPVLEETGLIEPVGIWVIDAACRQIAQWIEAGIGPVPVAVNVSVKQLLRGRSDEDPARGAGVIAGLVESPALEPAIGRALDEHGIPANLLEIELTESSLMLHAAKTVDLLQRLKTLGIQISIDDFGTGYSSLAYLKRFPIDTIKIDQTFVRDITTDPDDAAIAVAIISLAHSLKLKVVAEGVETREQLGFLRGRGCDQAQGYLLARPMPADAVAALLGASRVWPGGVDRMGSLTPSPA